MAQNYEIFINEIPLLLGREIEHTREMDSEIKRIEWDQTSEQLLQIVMQLEKGLTQIPVVIEHQDVRQLWETFRKNYRWMEAAGGVVSNEKDEILVIFRRGKWDLPKGKIDPGETPEQAAIREIEEETGASGLKINSHLTDTYHTYFLKEKRVLKKTFWYDVSCSVTDDIKPQFEEDIQVVKWVNNTGLKDCLKNTYASIKNVLGCYLGKG